MLRLRVRTLFRHLDKIILCVPIILSILSFFLLLGIRDAGVIRMRTVLVQAGASFVGFCLALVIAHFNMTNFAPKWKLYCSVAIALMLATFTALGQGRADSGDVNNHSWIRIGGFSLQPSEFLKIAFILSIAYHLMKNADRMDNPKILFGLLGHALVPIGLILLQRDLGVCIIMIVIIAILFIVGGFPQKWLIAFLLLGILFIFLAWRFVLSDYQKIRFLLLFNPDQYALNEAYQQIQGRIAFGSGGLFGIGIFSSDHRYVPDMYNDMIFTFIGESLGFLGTLFVLALYSLLIWRTIRIGIMTNNNLSRYICFGVAAMYASQIIINISMCLMIGPSIGVTLPFLSAGGSSVLGSYIGLGMLLSVTRAENGAMFSR